MANESFRFRRFNVKHDRCAMKVGTDGVLLGAWADAPLGRRISVLDIGTGTGLVALMMAQRFAESRVLGIEIDLSAAGQAAENAADSPFRDRISIVQTPLQSLFSDENPVAMDGKGAGDGSGTMAFSGKNPSVVAGKVSDFSLKNVDFSLENEDFSLENAGFADRKFEAIVCNPPYFTESLECPDEQRNLARHANTLDAHTLMACSARLLAPGGTLSVIVPYGSRAIYDYEASISGLFSSRICTVSTKPSAPPKRILLAYTNTVPARLDTEQIVIGGDKYREMTQDFYLK